MRATCVFLSTFMFIGLPVLGQAPTTTQRANTIADGGNTERGFDMAPETRVEVVESAVAAIPAKIPAGPFSPTWDSIKQNYSVPDWFNEARFGIFLHWGLYAVPAYHNEWYEKHMYATYLKWHTEHFGHPSVFGYKDFIPKFTCEKFDADQWAELFQKSGARYIMPAAQHHDNFAMWDSEVTPFCAGKMGPKRDLIGELAAAIRKRGMKFALSNHGIENFQFINPSPALLEELKSRNADLFDPKWTKFYNVADRSDEACKQFLVDWALRNVELIKKYQPDMLWFDNGIDQRFLDPLKLWLAAYYYNRAAEHGQAVTLSGKKAAFSPTNRNSETIGAVVDFEKVGSRSPTGIRTGSWQVDDPIASNSWGYIEDLKYVSATSIIHKLIDSASKNGNYVLNISPRADGSIPLEQQERLLEVGEWLRINGEAIYGTHSWIMFKDDGEADRTKREIRFTAKGDALYAILLGDWHGEQVTIKRLGRKSDLAGKIKTVSLLGADSSSIPFDSTDSGLAIKLPDRMPCKHACTLKIQGLKIDNINFTKSGNPQP